MDTTNLACNASCIFVLVGLVFQLNCRKMWKPLIKHLVEHNGMQHADDRHWAGIVSHTCWILGVVVFTTGMIGAGLSLGLTAPLAVTAAIQAPMLSLLYMVVVGASPMGLPGVHGPPIPPRILLSIAEVIICYALFQNMTSGAYDDQPMSMFYGMTAVSAAVPQITSLVHRSAVAKSVQKSA